MSDLAVLGLRFETVGSEAADRALDNKIEKSERAQRATDALAGSQRRGATATGQMAQNAVQAARAQGDLEAATGRSASATGRMTSAQLLLNRALSGMGGVLGSLRPVIMAVVTAIGALAGAVGGVLLIAIAALTAAWLDGEKTALGYEKAVSGVGRTAQVTATQLRAVTVAGAEQGNISLRSAQQQAIAYMQTGRVGLDSMSRLLAVGKDYASFMGVDAPAATRMLADAMKEPDKAAVEMTRSFGLLTQEQIKQVEAAVKSGDASRAQRILLDELTSAVSGHASQVGQIESAWDAVGQAVSNAITRLGEFLYMSKDEEIAQREAALRSPFVLPGARRDREQELTDLRFQRGYENAARANAAALGVLNQRQQAVTDGLERARPARAAAVRGMSDEERAYQALIRAATSMLESLDEQTATYGMTEEALIRYRTTQQVQALAANGWLEEEVVLANKLLSATEALIARQRDLTQVFDEAPNRQLQPLDIAPIELEDRLVTLARELREIDDIALDLGESLARSFGQGGQALGDMISTMTGYRAQVAELFADAGSNEDLRTKATQKAAILEAQAYGDMASAAKSFFGEKTAAYKILQGVEMAYRAVQFAGAVQAMALDTAETGSSIGNSIARGAAYAAEAVANIFAKLGPWGFPVAAAALGVIAAVGGKVMGGGGGGAAPTMPTTNTGTGTVLGAGGEQSDSLAKSLDMAERYYNRDLDFSSRSLNALRAIQANIGSLTTAIAREMNVGGALDPTGLNQGPTTSGGFLGAFSKTRSSELVGSGINLNGGALADLIAQGVSGGLYQIVQTTTRNSGFFGIGASTRTTNRETSTALDGDLSREFSRVLESLRAGVLTAAGDLGLTGAEAVLDAFQVSLGRISFEGMSSSEINSTLNAVFSAVGDDMASAILPGLSAFQRAGEGMLETLSRLATEYRTVDTTLQTIGMTFSAVGLASVEARSRLVDLTGGLDAFTEGASFFAENFLTDAQRIAPVQAAVTAELTRLGIASDISRSGFASLVMGLDVSTSAGATMFAALMRLAPALDQVISYTDGLTEAVEEVSTAIDLSRQRRSLEITLMEAQGNSAGALAARRADELAAMDASLRPLQLQINAALDLAEATRLATAAQEQAARAAEEAARAAAQRVDDARNDLSQAYEREASALRTTIDRFRGFATALAEFRQSLGTEGLSQTASYGASQSEFTRVAALARMGNEDALADLQGVSQAYLDQSRSYSRTSLDYLRDLASVRTAVEAAEKTAGRQATNAERQLAALDESVNGLLLINQSVLTVAQAIMNLQAALGAVLAPATPAVPSATTNIPDGVGALGNANRNWGAAENVRVNQTLAHMTGYAGDFGANGWANWIVQQDEATRNKARNILDHYGQSGRMMGFADGGVFTNGIVSQPTMFNMAQMGEAGPEAIMPLVQGPNGLGVRSTGANDNSDLIEEIRSLRQEVAALRSDGAKSARANEKTANLLTRVTRDGDALVTTDVAA